LSRLEQLAAECREVEIRDTLERIMAACRGPEPAASPVEVVAPIAVPTLRAASAPLAPRQRRAEA
jgi:hypothetical protein